MNTISVYVDQAREKANVAFDRHCAQWELLESNPAHTEQDVAVWLSVRDEFYDAQAEFERLIRRTPR
ncbi:hypothetical protein [Pseudomonas sp. 18058]|uniref:hypothetical protein n=1 Tax=Pseudomonas sp. 18058 TaxID=2681406 RepID=UPI00135BCBF5|nr:hypothetical protein [Pseudomonas sp. 18058]